MSFIAEVSGEMTSALLPFVLVAQGATGLGIGIVDGITEGIGDFFKLIGALMGKRTKHRRVLIGSGYLVATLSRLGVAASSSWPVTFAARSFDRVGKGLRTAPRDAMLADFVPPSARGKAFGLHLASDAGGGVLAILLVLGLAGLGLSNQGMVIVAAGIGILAIIPLFFVREVALGSSPSSTERGLAGREYVPFLLVASVFAVGRISYMFFVVATALRHGAAAGLGCYFLFVILESGSAFVWGRLGDGWGKRRVLAIGYVLTALASLAMISTSMAAAVVAFAALGLGMGATESLGRAFAAQVAAVPDPTVHLGQYHALTGFGFLLGGITAGLLWDTVSPQAAFTWGACVPFIAAVGLLAMRLRYPHPWRKGPPILPA